MEIKKETNRKIDIVIDKAQIEKDIQEIEDVLNNQIYFDREKAIQIIAKHHFSDWNIKIADIFLNVNPYTLQYAEDRQIANYLWVIRIYLNLKLIEPFKENTNG